MSRWKAAAIHLSISATIGLVAAALIFGVWYPPPYSQAAGAGELVLLLLGVDLVLGPLLTLVVFKPGKKGLKFDLALIAAMQACAFLYGMSVVTRARPAFIIGEIDRFVLVTANELDAADLAQGTSPEFRSIPWTGPKLIGVAMPTDPKERSDLTLSGVTRGKDIDKLPRYYVAYSDAAHTLLGRAKPVDAWLAGHPEREPILDAWLRQKGRAAADVVWLPLTSTREGMTMWLERQSGNVLGALPIDPW